MQSGLFVLEFDYNPQSICEGDSILLDTSYINTNGIHISHALDSMGYADIIVMTLSTNMNTSSTQSITINDGDSILLGGLFQTTEGMYTDTLINQFGCDSIAVTNLSIIPTSIDELSQKIKIYPNPAKNSLHINSEKAGELILFSVAGEVIIKKQISIYRKNYKNSDDHYITRWPNESELNGWYVKLKKQGQLKSHIHENGWLSGVFYIKIPKSLRKNEGSINLSLQGFDYPYDKNLPNLYYAPKPFDLILYPSSLFHYTVPFTSNEERHCIAFDLTPKRN